MTHAADFLLHAEAPPDDVAVALRVSTAARGRFGEPAIFLAQTASTNDVAAALAERGAAEGTMVLAQAQTAGRGRLGREWVSPPGAGLYLSLVIRDIRAIPLLTLAAGVAVADGVRDATGLPAALKWPNDVVVGAPGAPGGQRKLAGVLAEGSTSGGVLQYAILGIGVNVRPAAYPPAIADRASCLERELGRPVDAGPVLAAMLVALNRQMLRLAGGAAGDVLARWRELAPSAQGCRVEWTTEGGSRQGITAGIDAAGALLVSTPGGLHRIVSGELRWR